MAAGERLNDLNISAESLSTVSSLQSKSSSNEYSEDFDSSTPPSVEEMGRNPGIRELAIDGDGALSAFVQKKIDVLRENRPSCSARPTERNQKSSSQQESEEISPFWLRKLKILLKRTECHYKPGEDSERRRELGYVGEDIMRKDSSFIPDRVGREISYFQSAFEQIKFENLRFRSRKFIESDIHCPSKCSKCKKRKQRLWEAEFYKKSIQNVQRKETDQRFQRHLQATSSATLIAKIIETGPKPSWNSKELWDKVLAGGYQSVNKC